MVQMGDGVSVERCVQNLNNVTVGDYTLTLAWVYLFILILRSIFTVSFSSISNIWLGNVYVDRNASFLNILTIKNILHVALFGGLIRLMITICSCNFRRHIFLFYWFYVLSAIYMGRGTWRNYFTRMVEHNKVFLYMLVIKIKDIIESTEKLF